MLKRISILTIFSWTLVAQTNVATTAGSFLGIGAGARSLSLGGAFVSIANDVSALYWNPAGIVNIERPSVHVFHSPWLVETNYYYGGAVLPMGKTGTLGFAYTAVTMDEMMVRTVQRPEGTGERFSVSNLAMGITYSKRLTDRFSFGVQTKLVQEKIWQMTAKGIVVDIGSLFLTSSGMRIGMSISNFGGKIGLDGFNTLVDYDVDKNIYGNNDRIDAHLDAAKWPLPLIFRFGVSKDFRFSGNQKITVATDGIHPNNNVEYVNAGLEYNYSDLVFLRLGHSNLFMEEAEQGLTYGVGLNYKIPRGPRLQIDYVFRSFGVFQNVSGYSIDLTF
ncbi:MAG TPA: PorV/PorQ family protein [Candidatus Marinimicrobia bacterium]|nr:PorV/PorQ family protein [Candidatus Neomarinimicrobiota bacterium]